MNDEIEKEKGQWIKTINNYRMELGMSWEVLRNTDRKTLKEKIKEYDTQLWLQGMYQKPTLKWYMMGKQRIEYENCYRNNNHSTYLAKARTNSLQLEEHLGRGQPNYNTNCKLCGLGEENLEHFVVECPELEGKRNKKLMEGPSMTSEEKTIQILFKSKNYQETATMLKPERHVEPEEKKE